MTTKKKSKATTDEAAQPDLREALEPSPANLTAVLKDLKAVLADIPVPQLVPAPSVAASPVAGPSAAASSGAAPAAEGSQAEASPPAASPSGSEDGKLVLPQLDLVDALLHIVFADGLPCGHGQEARRRIAEGFVDRNEFRVTEAFEVEDMLRDLEIPNLFDRCLAVRDSVAQIYNDQNGVNLGFLRDAGISDRNTFFQRVPAVPPQAVAFLGNLLTVEELCFSDKSTLRAQQRLGLDAKNSHVGKFLDEVRALLKPYGHLPLSVGPDLASGKPNLKHPLSPACLMVRLAPAGKRR